MRRIVTWPSGASCSRRNSAKVSLATILHPQSWLGGLSSRRIAEAMLLLIERLPVVSEIYRIFERWCSAAGASERACRLRCAELNVDGAYPRGSGRGYNARAAAPDGTFGSNT